jgi:GcrA cell cycle regulator
MTWTEERKERAKTLWRDGYSASQIAADLGYVSRNAVIGIIHRPGLSGRGQPNGQIARRRTTVTPRSTKVALPLPKPVPEIEPEIEPEPVVPKRMRLKAPAPKGLSILDLTHATCKWPHGDGPYTFCGHVSIEGSPYCAYHEERARA